VVFIHIKHICSFFVAFFSATIDGRNLIFGHKLHIGTPYRGKRFLIRQIPTSCLQTGSRNLMGPKTLPTIWGTDMKLVTKYQICVIDSCWEKCDEKCAYKGEYCFTSVRVSVLPSFCPSKIFFVAFFSATINGTNLLFVAPDTWIQTKLTWRVTWGPINIYSPFSKILNVIVYIEQ
jgi:hypothetical protein